MIRAVEIAVSEKQAKALDLAFQNEHVGKMTEQEKSDFFCHVAYIALTTMALNHGEEEAQIFCNEFFEHFREDFKGKEAAPNDRTVH